MADAWQIRALPRRCHRLGRCMAALCAAGTAAAAKSVLSACSICISGNCSQLRIQTLPHVSAGFAEQCQRPLSDLCMAVGHGGCAESAQRARSALPGPAIHPQHRARAVVIPPQSSIHFCRRLPTHTRETLGEIGCKYECDLKKTLPGRNGRTPRAKPPHPHRQPTRITSTHNPPDSTHTPLRPTKCQRTRAARSKGRLTHPSLPAQSDLNT